MDATSPDAAEVYLEPTTKKRTETVKDDTPVVEFNAESVTVLVEETPTKVQRTTGFFGAISSFASGISVAGQSVVEQAKGVGKVVQKSLEENPILGNFNRMQQEFIQEKQANIRGPGVAPWVAMANEDEIKTQILELSKDKRNFTREPPAGASFEFDLPSAMPVATVLMREDPHLNELRFELVPKVVSETAFWRNYFYRISLIKQSSELSAESQDGNTSRMTEADRDDVSVASNLDLMDGSVVGDSDAHEHCPVGLPPVNPQDGAGTDKKSDDWEQELQQTLDSYELVDGEVGDNDLELELGEDNRKSV
ncbi:putative Synapse-associated protein 1 [Hypsibius exemplaris]|uniref:Synapse-associated protein 1 n=1 Tax=Hypsibius exemplaris TaxID=2072580 RepID=A0A1W0WS76_HYPEX|nr:putative Synapse-associated protein 1 [Hypsibius exemplaris]